MKENNSLDKSRTHFFTFYSFKGGVGRSMALLNTAALLAKRQRKVLVIDLDLEAPGISYLAAEEYQNKRQTELFSGKDTAPQWGFVDAIYDLIENGEKSPLGDPNEGQPFNKYIHPLDLKELAQSESSAQRIWVMPAGRLDDLGEYQRRLAAIALKERYEVGEGISLLRHFKNLLQNSTEAFDYVLVDSRTGLSTEAGIAARDLGNHLVVVTGLNKQNREGTAGFLRMIRNGKPKPKTLTLIASPIPLGEDELSSELLDQAEKDLSKAWSSSRVLKFKVLIPYHPRLALDEKPHFKRRTNTALTRAYASLEAAISEIANDTPAHFRHQFYTAITKEKWSDAIEPMRQLVFARDQFLVMVVPDSPLSAKLGDSALDPHFELLSQVADLDFALAELCARHKARQGAYDRALVIISNFLTKHESAGEHRRFAELWLKIGPRKERRDDVEKLYKSAVFQHPNDATLQTDYGSFLAEQRDRRADAENFFRKALELQPDNPEILGRYAAFLSDQRQRSKEAHTYYRRALELGPSDADLHCHYGTFLCDNLRKLDEAEEHYNTALQLEPDNAYIHCSYATFLCDERGLIELAEKHYKKALELGGDNYNLQVNWAIFLWEELGKSDEAKIHFHKALELAPDDPFLRSNYAEYLIVENDWKQAEEALVFAWNEQNLLSEAQAAECALRAAILMSVQGKTDIVSLGKLATLIYSSFEPGNACFRRVLAAMSSRLTADNLELYQNLANVISGKSSSSELEKIPRWNKVTSLPLEGSLFQETP